MSNSSRISFFKILLCIFLLINLCGCLGARELNELEIAIGLGVDKYNSANNILLTVQVVNPSQTGTASSSQATGSSISNAFWNVSSTGRTIFEAIRNMVKKTGYKIYASHSQVIIFSKKIASEGLGKYSDFFSRAHEIRPDTLILISKTTASKILDVKPKIQQLTGIHLANLINAYETTSEYKKVSLKDFGNALISGVTAPTAPLVGISHIKGQKNLYVSGMAVFKKTKMIGTLSPIESRGLLWATGEVKSGAIVVPTPYKKGVATLEILSSKTNLVPKIQKGKISIHIKIKENASLTEQSNAVDLFNPIASQALAKQQGKVIEGEIMKAFKKSRKLKADIFGFGEKIHKKYPTQWMKLRKKWNQIYPSIHLKLSVQTKIRKTESLTKPAAPTKE